MEELLSRTSKLKVTDDEGWEINEEGDEDIGKSCLIGRLCTMKPFSRSLLKNILCRLWNLGEFDWDMKIKKVTDKALFLTLSFKQNNHLERTLGRTPWVLNTGFLILERMKGIPTDWETTLTTFIISGRVLNLPIKAITKTNMLRLAGMAGEVDMTGKTETPNNRETHIHNQQDSKGTLNISPSQLNPQTFEGGEETNQNIYTISGNTIQKPTIINYPQTMKNAPETILNNNFLPSCVHRTEELIQEAWPNKKEQNRLSIRKRMGDEMIKESQKNPNGERDCKARLCEMEMEDTGSNGILFDVPITFEAGTNVQQKRQRDKRRKFVFFSPISSSQLSSPCLISRVQAQRKWISTTGGGKINKFEEIIPLQSKMAVKRQQNLGVHYRSPIVNEFCSCEPKDQNNEEKEHFVKEEVEHKKLFPFSILFDPNLNERVMTTCTYFDETLKGVYNVFVQAEHDHSVIKYETRKDLSLEEGPYDVPKDTHIAQEFVDKLPTQISRFSFLIRMFGTSFITSSFTFFGLVEWPCRSISLVTCFNDNL
ncbi:hypothetical protein G4B88_026881 [Cannabis sativa]|uniref:DUF4283 domain-containing protein n=1 Tax=Cannabis sativa TaxID=3483 RepID=A0A7J6FGL4_CANSA|nr:hypothetical protein G4B88_026881 [Cannabis sativa]